MNRDIIFNIFLLLFFFKNTTFLDAIETLTKMNHKKCFIHKNYIIPFATFAMKIVIMLCYRIDVL
jgi:hypothetical protein